MEGEKLNFSKQPESKGNTAFSFTEEEKNFYYSSSILLKFFYFDPENGEIKIKNKKFLNRLINTLKEDDPLFKKISEFIDKEDIPYFAFIYRILPFSLKNINKESLTTTIFLFKEMLKTFNDPQTEDELKDAINADSDNLSSFSSFNRLLALKLYQIQNKTNQVTQVVNKELIDFLKQPVNASLIVALRRIFLLRLLAKNYRRKFSKLQLDANLNYRLIQISNFLSNERIILERNILDFEEEKILALLSAYFIDQYLSTAKPPFIVDNNLVFLPPIERELKEEDLKSDTSRIININGNFYILKSGLLFPLTFYIISDKKIYFYLPFKPPSKIDGIGNIIEIGFYQLK